MIASTQNKSLAGKLQAAINDKTKPIGSLGQLEALALQIGLIQESVTPRLTQPAILIFAGDHGVVAEGVSAYPQDVTWQMVENFLAGGAAINVFARLHQIGLHIIDAGVNHDFGPREGLLSMKAGNGTANFAQQAAMTAETCAQAIDNGRAALRATAGNIVGFGEMGIGNTTAAAALMHVLTGIPVEQCVGAGTGLLPDGIAHKAEVIRRAVALHGPQHDPAAVLATYGGFEIATMVGAMLEAAAQRRILLIDGFIVTSALLVAARMAPAILDYCVFAHCSDESGHARMLQALGVKPVLSLGLRLGEGTGAALVLPLVQSAVAFLNEMATFSSAQVSEKSSV
ncbi:nicotinate-nucleotide--dimethylbenzimidazole phosphoribosyltransferase [Undibacterium luofuense]|uniref:Nicotinate-nucleotide--dimethylbenzimidazole phosphoribosyltransferase n=1 Tax=Undibacterium luofuense TaxID=2828733 RepID=A0A941I5K9_9BURK|nr:nicotinate-nucleotide--dimethylbenzimidazole phosphoribosyltransferase [Undibacterium luofuense]MBR7782907.1 nicotinate-nucleotide--dimethylbenzimidazole phosphoribosyltransferase [Undibacterium luofuense]